MIFLSPLCDLPIMDGTLNLYKFHLLFFVGLLFLSTFQLYIFPTISFHMLHIFLNLFPSIMFLFCRKINGKYPWKILVLTPLTLVLLLPSYIRSRPRKRAKDKCISWYASRDYINIILLLLLLTFGTLYLDMLGYIWYILMMTWIL